MPFTEIDMQLFTPVAMLKPENCSHTISKGKLSFSNKTWFCKAVQDPVRARYEILSQELYRLINSKQPETYLAKDHITNQYYILSEEVLGFQFIPTNKKIRLTKGIYSGLGRILVLSVFLHEIDLNLGNLGINADNEIIEVDGDWRFAALIRPDLFADKPSAITPELLKNFPKLTGYFAYNWLDICHKGGEHREDSDLFAEELSTAPNFRFEIHQTILLILLLSPAYLQKMVEFYLPENTSEILEFLLSRQAQLKNSAIQDLAFVEFIYSIQANVIGCNYMQQLLNFTINNSLLIQPADEKEALRQHFYSVWESLKTDLMHLKLQKFSNTPMSNFDTDEETMSISSSENTNRFFTPSPVSLRSTSSNTLRFNRTSSNLSQYFDSMS